MCGGTGSGMEDIDVDEKRDWTEICPTKEKVRRKGPRSSCPPIHGSSFVASSPETEAPWSLQVADGMMPQGHT